MFQSLRYSNLFLRLGLATVFIWFGVDKFLHPEYWLSSWIPQSALLFASRVGISGMDVVYASGVFELLVGTSVLSNIFIKIFSILAIVFLVTTLFIFGISEVLIRDMGLIGGFLALLFWPERRKLW
ncbi:MAG: DoxX family membrane protein [Candidatus Yanofskybacteria bacterium]|nr:DoxX family membrane protein [Candidatus Yanofskybacteria bacterium]